MLGFLRSRRMTDGARNVVVVALQEAPALGHDSIGPEHLLLGVIREDEGIAARVLESRNIREDDVRSRVRRMVDPGAGWTTDHLPFAPQGKHVLELAVHEALTFRQKGSTPSTSCSRCSETEKASLRGYSPISAHRLAVWQATC